MKSRNSQILDMDLHKELIQDRLSGLLRLMKGYRLEYAVAVVMQGLSAYSKALTYLLLSFFVDTYIISGSGQYPIWLIALGFVAFAGLQGVFTYISGIAQS